MAETKMVKIGNKEYSPEDLLALAEKDHKKGLKSEARRAAVTRLKQENWTAWVKIYKEEMTKRGFTFKETITIDS